MTVIKRLFDCLTAVIALIILLLPMGIISLLVLYKMGSPVLFIQTRAGQHGKPFKIYKFRTMLNLKDKNGNLLPNDQRETRFGKALRKTSLDELPQLINILKGDISLVGPRPLLMEYVPLYNKEQKRRLDVKPGLTGWAQINGRNAITWKEKFKYDIWYVDNWSIFLDLKILFMTFIKVVKSEGVNSDTNQMVKRFTGTEDE
ncbi:sugar transferase [Siminovitchia acidinfaciens]|uniref:Sugar transferase n=1 Tax=Siminovitchia acidinfaciens TaxID=2321395 RepID=A0A429XZH4_9BACI|nr:sugar transferase [Siminovitchia acidinfaciens]RST74183.1 sugar transferase [Siminovitchia acidinfaciens]